MKKLWARLSNERGGSDAVVSLIVLPIIIFLIFATINVSTYFQHKSMVQDFTRTAVRFYSINPTETTAVDNLRAQVTAGAYARSSTTPNVACGKVTGRNADGTPIISNATIIAGEIVACSITNYSFVPIAQDPFGFSDMTKRPFTVYSESLAEAGN